jgi:hypothetical protein
LYGDETFTLRKAERKYLGGFEMWCWKKMKIRWTDRVRNGDAEYKVKANSNILHKIQRRQTNSIGPILRRNCVLQHLNEGKMEGKRVVMRSGGRRHKQLMNELKERRRYWKLKKEALRRTLWRTHFGSVIDHS